MIEIAPYKATEKEKSLSNLTFVSSFEFLHLKKKIWWDLMEEKVVHISLLNRQMLGFIQ